jgi:hypothetical protein
MLAPARCAAVAVARGIERADACCVNGRRQACRCWRWRSSSVRQWWGSDDPRGRRDGGAPDREIATPEAATILQDTVPGLTSAEIARLLEPPEHAPFGRRARSRAARLNVA